MKKISFFAFALAAGLMMGCSDDNSLVEGPSTGSSTTGKGYISLAINLPTQPSSRANDNFDDGTAQEYNVEDATLFVSKEQARMQPFSQGRMTLSLELRQMLVETLQQPTS